MRISATAFAQIKDDRGRYAVLINKGALRRSGKRVLSPIGGGLAAQPAGRAYLERLGATAFEGDGGDIRCRIADPLVPSVMAWFGRRRQREISALREVEEELTTETGVLSQSDLRGIGEMYMGVHYYDAVSPRADVPERQTKYLIEVFAVTLRTDTLRKLVAASLVPTAQRWVYFVSANEIKQGATKDGIPIAPISQFIL